MLVDANVLLYAVDEESRRHALARGRLCLEHGLAVVSADSDFARFAELKWINPFAA